MDAIGGSRWVADRGVWGCDLGVEDRCGTGSAGGSEGTANPPINRSSGCDRGTEDDSFLLDICPLRLD